MIKMIKLKEGEYEIYEWFKRYKHIWKRARKELRPGSLVLHFNNKGDIKKMEYHEYEVEGVDKVS